jgi:integrase/recombinase XerD
LFLLDTGARASELCGVTIADVGFESGKVLLRNTKGGDHRYVYLGRRAKLALLLYVKEERPDPAQTDGGKDRLFLTKGSQSYGYPMTRHTLRSIIVRLGERAGVKGATTHRLRHSMAIAYLRQNLDPFRLMRALGHHSLDVTLDYCRSLTDLDVQSAVQKIAPSDNWRL